MNEVQSFTDKYQTLEMQMNLKAHRSRFLQAQIFIDAKRRQVAKRINDAKNHSTDVTSDQD